MSVWSPLADRSIANIHKLLLTFGVALLFSSIASADQASYVNAGGTTLSGGNTVASGVNSPAGTLTIGAATTGGSKPSLEPPIKSSAQAASQLPVSPAGTLPIHPSTTQIPTLFTGLTI